MRRTRAIQAFSAAALTVLVPWGATYVTDTAVDDVVPDEVNPVVVEGDLEPCDGIADVFQLDVPGTYTALAVSSSGPLVTEVRGAGGELLATSHPATATTRPVDLPTGFRFGIAAPQVFEVESTVTIQVQREDSPYDLFLVRIGNTPEPSGFDVHPPLERVASEPGFCSVGERHDIFKIRTDAVYSDVSARQVFVVHSQNASPIAECPMPDSADRPCALLMASRSLARGHFLVTSRFFAVR